MIAYKFNNASYGDRGRRRYGICAIHNGMWTGGLRAAHFKTLPTLVIRMNNENFNHSDVIALVLGRSFLGLKAIIF